MSLRFLVFFFLILLASRMASAADIGPNIQIPTGGTLRGHFMELHSFPNAKTPLVSEGYFILSPAHGIIWGIEKPLPITVVITSSGLTQRLGTLRLPSVPASKMPILAQTTMLLTSALTGQWQNLQKDFVVASKATPTGWNATLTSRAEAALPFRSILATGNKFVDTADVSEYDGSLDNIAFSQEAVSPYPPSATELALFAGAP